MTDRDTGDYEGLRPQEALDPDERLDNDDDAVEPPERWHAADGYGTTPAEQSAGAPLGQRLAEERPDVQPVEVPERPVVETPIDELDESVDAVGTTGPTDLTGPIDDTQPGTPRTARGADDVFGDANENEEPVDPDELSDLAALDEVGGVHETDDPNRLGGAEPESRDAYRSGGAG